MASSLNGARWPARLVLAAALAASGAAGSAALHQRLYANAVLAGLVASWLAALVLGEAAPLPPPAPPPPEDAGREEEMRRLRFMLDHAPVPLVALRADGTLRAINRAARAVFRADDLIALNDPPAHGAPSGLARAIAAGPAAPWPEQTRRYAISWATIAGARETLQLAALVDIQSEIKQAEAAALRELLQTLSHEIMNSLTPVISLSATAAALLDAGDIDRTAEAIATVARRTAGLDRFVRGYRALAQIPAPSRRPTWLARLLADQALLFAARWSPQGVTLRLTPPRSDIEAVLDPDLISQALLALLTNAAEAALANPPHLPWVALSAGMENTEPWLLVEDSGAGVPQAAATLIFQPLYTTRLNGSGIGLGLARQIARAHGGDLTLLPSPPARGARFLLRLG